MPGLLKELFDRVVAIEADHRNLAARLEAEFSSRNHRATVRDDQLAELDTRLTEVRASLGSLARDLERATALARADYSAPIRELDERVAHIGSRQFNDAAELRRLAERLMGRVHFLERIVGLMVSFAIVRWLLAWAS